MRYSKTCPKCGSKRILVGQYDGTEGGVHIRLGPFCTCDASCHICVDCGYIESWLDDRYYSKLQDRYERENN